MAVRFRGFLIPDNCPDSRLLTNFLEKKGWWEQGGNESVPVVGCGCGDMGCSGVICSECLANQSFSPTALSVRLTSFGKLEYRVRSIARYEACEDYLLRRQLLSGYVRPRIILDQYQIPVNIYRSQSLRAFVGELNSGAAFSVGGSCWDPGAGGRCGGGCINCLLCNNIGSNKEARVVAYMYYAAVCGIPVAPYLSSEAMGKLNAWLQRGLISDELWPLISDRHAAQPGILAENDGHSPTSPASPAEIVSPQEPPLTADVPGWLPACHNFRTVLSNFNRGFSTWCDMATVGGCSSQEGCATCGMSCVGKDMSEAFAAWAREQGWEVTRDSVQDDYTPAPDSTRVAEFFTGTDSFDDPWKMPRLIPMCLVRFDMRLASRDRSIGMVVAVEGLRKAVVLLVTPQEMPGISSYWTITSDSGVDIDFSRSVVSFEHIDRVYQSCRTIAATTRPADMADSLRTLRNDSQDHVGWLVWKRAY